MTTRSRLAKLLPGGLALLLGIAMATPPARAATAEQEQALVAAYKKAFEGKDAKTLHSFLYTKGADPMVVEFYEAMQTSGMGGQVTRIELLALTPEQQAEARAIQDSPSGKVRLPVAATRKLVLEVKESGPDGSSTSTSECFVGEVDGKLVVLVPAPVK